MLSCYGVGSGVGSGVGELNNGGATVGVTVVGHELEAPTADVTPVDEGLLVTGAPGLIAMRGTDVVLVALAGIDGAIVLDVGVQGALVTLGVVVIPGFDTVREGI